MYRLQVKYRVMYWSKMFGLKKYKLNAGLISDIGNKRLENQDNFSFGELVNADRQEHVELELRGQKLPKAYAIMDGMGGEKLGAQASLEAAGFFSSIHKDILTELDNADQKRKEEIFEDLIYSLNERVRKMASEQKVRLSGTTLASIFFTEEKAYVLSVGDSEVFLVKSGNIDRINKLDALTITVDDENLGKRTVKGGLSQFLGMDTSEYGFHLNIKEIELEKDDIFIICSDGLTDHVEDVEIALKVCEYGLMDSVRILLDLALERCGKDNITILRVDVV